MTMLPKKKIIGIELRTTNQNGQSQRDIPRHWHRFYEERISDKITGKMSSRPIAVYTKYEGDFMQPYSLIVGYEVESLNNVPKGCVGIETTEAPYAVYPAKGAFPQALIQTWQQIWSSEVRRAYTFDFEVYPENFDRANPESQSEITIYIAIH